MKNKFVKNKFAYLLVVVFLLAAWFILENLQIKSDDNNSQNKIKIATSIYPLTDIVENIGKDKVEVVQILPSGASPHGYEPQVSDVKNLKNAQAVFYIGHGLDDWTLSLAKSAGVEDLNRADKYVSLLEKTEEHSHEDEDYEDNFTQKYDSAEDPHYWLSLENGEQIARQIAEKLVLLDSINEDYYRNNLDNYVEDMRSSKLFLNNKIKDLKNRKILVYHDSWQYIARDFDLEVLGALKTSEAHEKGPKHLEELYGLVEDNNIEVVYGEEQFSLDQVKPLAQDLDLEVMLLDPLGANSAIDSYIKLMEYNILKIYEGQSSRN